MTMMSVANNTPGHPGAADAAVVGVAATRTRPAPHARRRTNWSAMHQYAALIADHTEMRALPLPLTHNDPAAITAHLTRHGTDLAAIVLIGLDATAAAHVARAVHDRGGPTVISELHAQTATLGAATLTCLRQHNIDPRHGTIAVTAPDTAPQLGPLLASLGIGPMLTWHHHDTEPPRLPPALAAADLLIDLDNSIPEHLAPHHTEVPQVLFRSL
ncbi:hypothetical protein [Mycolicibacterium sp.]|uniref:hypothetical protein n=1 Tax=Mycolicibacterium sp. TaxID=2320850 RepID=UPI0037CA24DE